MFDPARTILNAHLPTTLTDEDKRFCDKRHYELLINLQLSHRWYDANFPDLARMQIRGMLKGLSALSLAASLSLSSHVSLAIFNAINFDHP